jgi:hypothetical protein
MKRVQHFKLQILFVAFSYFATTINGQPRHDTTYWRVKPSFKYDVLCFLNTLTADSFYIKYYPKEFAYWNSRLDAPAKQALDTLYKRFKKDNQSIISAFYCLYFSVVKDSTLVDMIATTENPSVLKQNFRKTTYYDDGAWRLFASTLPHLKQVLLFMKNNQFEKYWQDSIANKITSRMTRVNSEFAKFNTIPKNEKLLGRQLPSDTITVNMLYFSQPHGIKVWGNEFLTDIAWPLQIVIRNAVHEMMHPALNTKNKKLKKLIAKANKDAFLKENFDNRNSAFGYNTIDGLMEEDCVQAMEQLINEHFKIEVDAKKRWSENDNGLHKFAAILYSQMKREDYLNNPQKGIEKYLVGFLKKENTYKGLYDEFLKN